MMASSADFLNLFTEIIVIEILFHVYMYVILSPDRRQATIWTNDG